MIPFPPPQPLLCHHEGTENQNYAGGWILAVLCGLARPTAHRKGLQAL